MALKTRFLPLVVIVLGCKESAWTPMGSAELVLSQIKLGGVSSVAKRVDDDATFAESVMSGIATGDSAWMEVAGQLTPASSAAEASFVIALASALPHAPQRVLPLLQHKYSVDDVCGIPFLEADSVRINRYYDSTSFALAAVRDTTLTALRDRCAATLHEEHAKKLERIDPSYVVKNKPAPARKRRR